MTKSDQIRAFIEANPSASAAAIQKALKKEKINVSLPLVYTVMKQKRKAKEANGAKKMVSVDALLAVKKAAAEIGSIEEARKAVALLAKLGL